jgi:hypothetical protein
MKAKSVDKRSSNRKVGSKKCKAAAGAGATGCNYSVKWTLLANTKGYVPVWIPAKQYDKAAKYFAKRAKGGYAKNLFRQRMAPLGVEYTCGGTCDGGWCKEHEMPQGGSSALFVCECMYFV